MLSSLIVLNQNSSEKFELKFDFPVFRLNTCQRQLIMFSKEDYVNSNNNFEFFNGEEGYKFLLEVLCGMQSKVIAESEIVSQFKEAYQGYLSSSERDPRIIRILEKLLKDAKEIRTNYLIGVGQKTYAAIARKIILKEQYSKRVLVVGTGNLSIDIINQLKKRFDQIYVTGRNSESVQDICLEHMTRPLEWKDYEMYEEFQLIVNTIGADNITLFCDQFFSPWHSKHGERKLFIDLGSPTILNTDLTKDHGVIKLEDIFEQSVIREKEKIEKINQAQQAITELTKKRLHFLSLKQKGARVV